MDNWYNHIYWHTYVVATTIIVGVAYMRRLSALAKLILLLVIINVSVDIIATYIDKALGYYTLTLYNVFTPLEFIYIFLLYSTGFNKRKKKLLVYYLSWVFFLFACINFIFIQGSDDFNTYTFSIGSLITSGLSYLLLRQLVLSDNDMFNNVLIWFIAATIVFYLTAIPVLSIPTPIIMSGDLYKFILLFKIKDFAYVTWSILIAIGFICQEKKII